MSIQEVLTVILAIWNALVYSTYAWDKYCAAHQRWRVPERVLLGQALGFGGLGALLAGHFLRHKVRKWYFQLTWWLGFVVLLACLYMIWFGGYL
ncbi:uncharacterized membrane protein YsdA (DUF1294 family) [Streptococcus rupicaprae]|uniref:Uncharacterized membrane protein YsdA (DUF1294 family) n=1 Tax=Streptococcus rupicaprae TaxID=759619 RepID=A0ABV2FKA5_9STRE